jgi:hypothetical protein
MGIIVSDPAGTMPVLLRRDAEAFSYIEWSADGTGLMLGGTRSGAAWAVNMSGEKHSLDANLRDLRAVHWTEGGVAVLADNPVTRLVTLNYRSGGVISARGVGIAARGGEPATRLAVPYIHQVNDTSAYGNGHWACGPTSVVMTLAYYGKLLPWGQYMAEVKADETGDQPPPRSASRSLNGKDYAPYVANAFVQNGRSFTASALDAGGRPMSGLYGTICPTGFASWQMMQSTLSSFGLSSTYLPVTFDGVVGALKRGHPVILGNELTSAGHILVVIGYTEDGSLLVHDPYGNRFEPGYGGNYGGGVLYQWKRATARRALEVVGVYPPPPPPPYVPKPTRTPTAGVAEESVTPAPDVTPGAEGTPTETPLPGIIPATPLGGEPEMPPTRGPIVFSTPEPTPTMVIEAPAPDVPPVPTQERLLEVTPTPLISPESLFYTLPLLLSTLAITVFRRVRD